MITLIWKDTYILMFHSTTIYNSQDMETTQGPINSWVEEDVVCVYIYMKSESESRSVVSDSLWPHGLYSPWNSPGQNTGVGSLSLLQQIFLAQESNWSLLHCRWNFYQLSYQESPENIILRKVSWREKEKYYDINYMRNLKIIQMNLYTKQKTN